MKIVVSKRKITLLASSIFGLAACDDENSSTNDQSGGSASARSWGIAQIIDSKIGSASLTQTAFDDNGNALAVWSQFDDTYYSVYANRYVVGTGWETAQLLENADFSVSAPQLAVDANGNAIAIWTQATDAFDAHSIFTSRYTVGSGWGHAALVEVTEGRATEPKIAINKDGNAIAVWRQEDNSGPNNIYANHFTLGIGWGTAQPIESTQELAYSPQVSIDKDGNAMAVWLQTDSTDTHNIYANYFTPSGGWGTALLLESSSGSATDPTIEFDVHGNAIALWQLQDGDTQSIQSNRFTRATGWEPPHDISSTKEISWFPQLAFDAQGNAMAVWEQYDPDNFVINIQANRYVAGIGWGTPELLETNEENAIDPQIAMDKNGNGMAIWSQQSGFATSVYANRYEFDIGWRGRELVEEDDGMAPNPHHASNPRIAIDSEGVPLAIWTQLNDPFAGVYASRWQ